MTEPATRPGPSPDEDSAVFWQGLRDHRVLLQQCSNCAEVRFPPMPGCPNCGSPDAVEVQARGDGQVYSWIVVHRPLETFAEADLPVTIATVELAEGCRLLGHLRGAAPAVDLPVRAGFLDHADWTELIFVPSEGPA